MYELICPKITIKMAQENSQCAQAMSQEAQEMCHRVQE